MKRLPYLRQINESAKGVTDLNQKEKDLYYDLIAVDWVHGLQMDGNFWYMDHVEMSSRIYTDDKLLDKHIDDIINNINEVLKKHGIKFKLTDKDFIYNKKDKVNNFWAKIKIPAKEIKLNEALEQSDFDKLGEDIKTGLGNLIDDHYFDIDHPALGLKGLTIQYANGKDKSEWPNGYLDNDPARMLFSIREKSDNQFTFEQFYRMFKLKNLPKTKVIKKTGTLEQIKKYAIEKLSAAIKEAETIGKDW